ncbi:MAG: sulfotransferase domain-containing protein [Lachnospiraceae bacterium]|nr:sulfotransferase domain-containing protein [Lachnospiraceae bacterium]
MGYPDFVCMGFQKCGTTTLFEILRQHPQVALCRDVKEPMFYRVPILSTLLGGRHYYKHRYFGHISGDDARLLGEVNAGLTFRNCAKRLGRNLPPDTKMIFMMRNPADRSYSAYKYFMGRGFFPASVIRYDRKHGHAAGFDHYVHSVLDNPRRRAKVMWNRTKYISLSQSRYGACIADYLEYFKPENMKFIVFEEFIQDEEKACRELYEFLGIQEAPDIRYGIRSNEGKDRPVSPLWSKIFMIFKGANYFIYDFCAMSHWAPQLYRKFYRLYRKTRGKALEPDPDRSRMLPETRDYLMRYFDADIQETERLTGRNLHEIWNCE